MSVTKSQQVLYVDYVSTETFRIPIGIDLNDNTKVRSYKVIRNTLVIEYCNGTSEHVDKEFNSNEIVTVEHPDDSSFKVEEEEVECCANCNAILNDEFDCPKCGELTDDICEACETPRRTNYDWAFRDEGKKSFCKPCGKKFDDGELSVFNTLNK